MEVDIAQKCVNPGCNENAEKDSNYCAQHKPQPNLMQVKEAQEFLPQDKK
jgi:hypothetical protein